MDGKDLFKGLGKLWQGAVIKAKKSKPLPVDDIVSVEDFKQDTVYIREDEKVNVEIREIVRIRPQDFQALKSSFEEWAHSWD